MRLRLSSLVGSPLSVPLVDPFVIASARVEVTRAALVEVVLVDEEGGQAARGLGEAAALPPVTGEDQPDILAAVQALGEQVIGASFQGNFGEIGALLAALDDHPVARSGVEAAILDAAARLAGQPLFRWLAGHQGPLEPRLTSDITVPIHAPAYMGTLAAQWRALGFRCFKVKVGLDAAQDLEGLAAMRQAVPDARFRLDANGGFRAEAAIALYQAAIAQGLLIECFEQPCARDDLAGMAEVTRSLPVPVIADESVRSLADLERLATARAASGVNLKLGKMGGLGQALAIGRRAAELGLARMIGGMVETRLGMTTAAHVAVALGGVELVDLDTAWLLREDPFVGGYEAAGPEYRLPEALGLGVARREAASALSGSAP